MKILTRIVQALVVVAVPVMALFAPLHLFVTDVFVRHEYALPHVPASTRFTEIDRLAISDVMIDFLRGRASADELANVALPSGELVVNGREVSHMQDVKRLTDVLFDAAAVAAGVVLFGALYLLYRAERKELAGALRGGIWLGVVTIVGIVAASFINFDVFFSAFHALFFADGTWLFNIQDTLIQLYPEPLWMDAVWKYGIAIGIEMLLLYIVSAILGSYVPDIERI